MIPRLPPPAVFLGLSWLLVTSLALAQPRLPEPPKPTDLALSLTIGAQGDRIGSPSSSVSALPRENEPNSAPAREHVGSLRLIRAPGSDPAASAIVPTDTSASASASGSVAFPSLGRAISLARDHAPQVVSARGAAGVAASSRVGARLGIVTNPYLEVFADRGTMGTKDVAISANLWFPIEMSGQRSRRILESDALVAWASTNVESARALAAAEAIRAYGSAVIAAERVRLAELILATARVEASLYQARLEAGDATILDARLATLEVSRNLVAYSEAKADLSRALADLARATGDAGYEPPAAGSSTDPPALPADTTTSAWAERSVDRSPHVQAIGREAEFRARERDRWSRDAHVPVNLILSAGRGDLGEVRLGGGMSWTFPVFRTNQGEQSRADAERLRALSEQDAQRRAFTSTLRALQIEASQIKSATDEMATTGEPTAQLLVDAALEMQRAGKGEFLRVLIMRRDLAQLRTRHLELLRRAWSVTGDIVAITGDLP